MRRNSRNTASLLVQIRCAHRAAEESVDSRRARRQEVVAAQDLRVREEDADAVVIFAMKDLQLL